MKRVQAMNILRQHHTELTSQGVKSLAIFGSVARGVSSSDSDIDLLIDFDRPTGLFEFIRIKLRLEELLGLPVDLVTQDALHPALRENILKEAIDVSL
jgi:uncharacterized protein